MIRCLRWMPILCFFLCSSSFAGVVRIETEAKYFTVRVSVKKSAQGAKVPLPQTDGVYELLFGEPDFEQSAYARRILVLTWTPKETDKPATGVNPFTLELPVLLRQWRLDDEYTMQVGGFEGIGQRFLSRYEEMTTPGDQWLRLFASLHQADHYAQRIRPDVPEAGRALNTAIDGLNNLVRSFSVAWLEPPLGLQQKIELAFDVDNNRRASLSEAISNINSQLWREITEVERALQNKKCTYVANTIAEFDRRRQTDPRSFELQYAAGDDTYETVKQRILAAPCIR
jgi:hypothetical protein